MAATYYEIVVKGDEKLVKGFIRGFELGCSLEGGFWLCGDHPIDTGHWERLRLHGHHVHVVCTSAVRRSFLAAFAKAAESGVEVVSDKKIARAWFEFEFDTYSRDVAASIKGILKTLPAGLQVLAYEPKETVDKKARGVELYSPVHEYRFEGKGRVEGDLEKLLAFHEKLEAIDFANTDKIHLET